MLLINVYVENEQCQHNVKKNPKQPKTKTSEFVTIVILVLFIEFGPHREKHK